MVWGQAWSKKLPTDPRAQPARSVTFPPPVAGFWLRRQALRKLRKEQQKALIRETREKMRKRLERPREKEIARMMGKRVEGTMAKSVKAWALHKRLPGAVQGVLCREKWRIWFTKCGLARGSMENCGQRGGRGRG